MFTAPTTPERCQMNDSQPRRAILEGLVILVSILLAFGIDAWWDATREGDQAYERLRSAQEELAGVAPRLLDEANQQQRIVVASRELMRLISSVSEGELVETPDTLWAATLTVPEGVVPTVAVDALASTGALAHVRSRTLRDSLGAWPSQVVDDLANQGEQWRFVTEEFSPLVRRKADVREAFGLVRPWYRREIPAARTVSTVRVIRERELLNALAERAMNADLSRGDYEGLSRHSTALARSIEHSLAR